MFSYSEYLNIFVAIGKEPVTVEEQPEEENDEEDEVIDAVSVVLHLHNIKATSTFILRYNALIQTLQRSPNHE